jgi:cyclopropane fatty-acyl-phospholipid synthase-like methyltransferase
MSIRFAQSTNDGTTGHQVLCDAASFWSDHADKTRIRDLSHWRGEGRWTNDRSWRAIGDENFHRFSQFCQRLEITHPPRVMLEWGPGGGANAVRFAREMEVYYGVDISRANLAECSRQLTNIKGCKSQLHMIDISHPEEYLRRIPESVGFFLSTSVFQHFPSQRYGQDIVRLAAALLADRGIAVIQIRYEDGNPKYAAKTSDYIENAVTMTSYPLQDFHATCQSAGFHVESVELCKAINYAWFFLRSATIDGKPC